jgi:poly(A) polymerase
MKVTDDWIRAAGLQQVLACLTGGGHRAYLVGGCVRNALLGLPVTDLDIATDAHPDQVMALCAAAGLRTVPTGIDHGTVTVVADKVAYEVTTFRRDIETDGRRAKVRYATAIEEDAARRDFTMNALYLDADGTLMDPLQGIADLVARRVRFVGLPADRIAEDYLRILRFFRFHALYGDPAAGLDAEGFAACAANLAGIDTLSRERVGNEMRKLLAARDPAPAVAAMAASGVLAAILPGADPRALAPLVHLEAGAEPNWLRRLAAIGGQDATLALRLSRDEAKGLTLLRDQIGSGAGAGELGWRHGVDLARDVTLLRSAVLGAPTPDGWAAAAQKGAHSTFPVSAADLPGLTPP